MTHPIGKTVKNVEKKGYFGDDMMVRLTFDDGSTMEIHAGQSRLVVRNFDEKGKVMEVINDSN